MKRNYYPIVHRRDLAVYQSLSGGYIIREKEFAFNVVKGVIIPLKRIVGIPFHIPVYTLVHESWILENDLEFFQPTGFYSFTKHNTTVESGLSSVWYSIDELLVDDSGLRYLLP